MTQSKADKDPTTANSELRAAIYSVIELNRDKMESGWIADQIMMLVEPKISEARKGHEPKVMPKHRRRAMTPQERSFEAEVASFVRAYPDMTLHDYWVGRWHQKSNLGVAQLNPQKPEENV